MAVVPERRVEASSVEVWKVRPAAEVCHAADPREDLRLPVLPARPGRVRFAVSTAARGGDAAAGWAGGRRSNASGVIRTGSLSQQ
jgi:hypothetical protein